ncbi:LVIVD repeat-containing protein, partial [Xanthovirga aplysinae]|uniref:LVIVD repeat-containing protein n=1 Tax=Xanthovirga aplysinae TaxID=2529853 RepID=UPI003CCE3261|nr:Na-Ca exchanger/integrin-beta4 [Xanthovirga aplysinae]
MTISHSGWVTDDHNYLFICNENDKGIDITIWDISNPSNPTRVSQINDEDNVAHNLYIIGNYAYVSYYRAGLRIYDVSDPNDPFLVYQYDTNDSPFEGSHINGAFGVYPFTSSGNIYVSD